MTAKNIAGIFCLLFMAAIGRLQSQELIIDDLKRIQYLIQFGNYEKAIEFTESLDDSLFCEKNELLGFSYKNLEKYDLAVRHYETYINQCNPSYIQRINLGDSYFQIDSLDLAEEQFMEVLKSTPNFALAYYNLGQIEYSRGNKEKAANHFLQAINNTGSSLDFDYVEMMIQTLLDLQKYDNALAIIDQVISIWEEDTNEYKYSFILKSMIIGEMGQYKKAIQEIDKVLESKIEHPFILIEAYSNKLIFYTKLNETEKACIEYQNIKNLNPQAAILREYDCK